MNVSSICTVIVNMVAGFIMGGCTVALGMRRAARRLLKEFGVAISPQPPRHY